MWLKMEESLGTTEASYRPSIPTFIKDFLYPALKEILEHKRFKECTVNADRVRGHLPLLLSFIGLFIVTCYSLFTPGRNRNFYPGNAWTHFNVESV